MNDNTAVRWSDYEAHRTTLDSETRSRILSDLATLVRESTAARRSSDFQEGIRAAMRIVQSESRFPRP